MNVDTITYLIDFCNTYLSKRGSWSSFHQSTVIKLENSETARIISHHKWIVRYILISWNEPLRFFLMGINKSELFFIPRLLNVIPPIYPENTVFTNNRMLESWGFGSILTGQSCLNFSIMGDCCGTSCICIFLMDTLGSHLRKLHTKTHLFNCFICAKIVHVLRISSLFNIFHKLSYFTCIRIS